MIKLVEMDVKKIQLKDLNLQFLCKFYEDRENETTILLIFDNDKYVTNISYQEAQGLYNEDEVKYFLYYLFKRKSIDDGLNALKRAEKIFMKNPYIRYVLLLKDNNIFNEKKALFYTDMITIEEEYKRELTNLKKKLKKEGIYTYLVRIPYLDELEKQAQHNEWKIGALGLKKNWGKERENEVKRYLNRFTELEYDVAKKEMLNKAQIEEGVQGNETRTVFLVGPCIVGGWDAFSGESLYEILYKKIKSLGLDYKIVKVIITPNASSNIRAVLEYDIRKNDIVLLIESHFISREKADIKLDYIYNNYAGEKWLYSDIPIHTTRVGNELISDELIKNIIKPVSDISQEIFDKKILHYGKKQLTYEEFWELQRYLENIKKYDNESHSTIGACVMNCNPFTKGHYYLIEYASRKVDFLYIFIVEEDACDFPFADRIEMVRRGIKEIKNVVVLPSGRFIISKGTFKNYFEKELNPNAVIDARKDTMIFREYVAPTLRISQRFVGQEPMDKITEQYNQLLKKDLSPIVEVIEIPRKEISGEIISASRVRNCLKEDNWNEIEKIVPKSTLEYLKSNYKRIGKEMKHTSLDEIIEFIQCHKSIVIYSSANILDLHFDTSTLKTA